jgi:hypothetical protein
MDMINAKKVGACEAAATCWVALKTHAETCNETKACAVHGDGSMAIRCKNGRYLMDGYDEAVRELLVHWVMVELMRRFL